MSLITNLKLAFTEGFHGTTRAVSREWKSLGDRLQGDAQLMAATAHDVDRLARQEDNVFAWAGIKSLSALYGASSTVVRGVVGLAYGAPDFVATVASRPQDTPKLIWDGMQHCSSETVAGAESLARGDLAQGLSHFLDGLSQAWIMVAGGRGMVRGVVRHTPVVFKTFADGVNTMLDAGRPSIPNTPANIWFRLSPQRGAVVIDPTFSAVLTKADFARVFRQATVSDADLQSLTQHANANVSGAARQVLAERTNPLPEGYMPIPGGEFKGQNVSPFTMKATPVTNGEWLSGVDGRPRFVQLVEDPVTKVIRVEEVMAQPPSSVNPKINFDAGEVAVEGSRILVKLVDNPSVVYDASGQVFSRGSQPVVGVSYYHAQAWVFTDASGRLALPADMQWEAVASKYGTQEFGTATGKLYGAGGRKLGHFDEWNDGKGTTADVNDPRYPAGPYGVHSQYNVWRWMQADPQLTNSYGLRGASWSGNGPGSLRAAFRDIRSLPLYRYNDVGFQPVVLPGLK